MQVECAKWLSSSSETRRGWVSLLPWSKLPYFLPAKKGQDTADHPWFTDRVFISSVIPLEEKAGRYMWIKYMPKWVISTSNFDQNSWTRLTDLSEPRFETDALPWRDVCLAYKFVSSQAESAGDTLSFVFHLRDAAVAPSACTLTSLTANLQRELALNERATHL